MRPRRALSLMVLIVILSVLGAANPAPAAAPQQKNQSPGYYRLMVGAFEITALCDGTLAMPVGKLMVGIPATDVDTALRREFLKDPAQSSVNGFLVNTGNKLVLIDTGAGIFLGPTVGKLVVNLEAAGYTPEEVDEIYITHMHGDHIGGLLSNRKAAFPNAIVRASRQEADYWFSKPNMAAAPVEARQQFAQAVAAFKPYVMDGRFKTFDGAVELSPGIRALPAPGHTPGHTIFVAESRGTKIVFWGDAMPGIRYDTDLAAAAAQRAAIFADAAEHGDWVAGAHLAFPGIGHLRAVAGGGYEFVPATYLEP